MGRRMDEVLRSRLAALLDLSRVSWDCPLRGYTTFDIGGPAEALVIIEDESELAALLDFVEQSAIAWQVIGRGSNLLVADRGFAGVILLFGSKFGTIETVANQGPDRVVIRAGAGCSMVKLLDWCCAKGLAGLEFLTAIPGSVGGGVVMNAGAWGHELAEVISGLRVMEADGRVASLARHELEFGYRSWCDHQPGQRPRLVLAAEFELRREEPGRVRERCRQLRQQRLDRQPKQMRNAGSFFKNPPGEAAGQLIDRCGLKGLRCGGAMISRDHANFLVNGGEATAAEVRELMTQVQERVWQAHGIRLEPEVHFIGFES